MRRKAFSDEIREAVNASGKSRYKLCCESRVDQASLSKFMTGERGLSMGSLDKLAAVLDLHAVVKATRKGE